MCVCVNLYYKTSAVCCEYYCLHVSAKRVDFFSSRVRFEGNGHFTVNVRETFNRFVFAKIVFRRTIPYGPESCAHYASTRVMRVARVRAKRGSKISRRCPRRGRAHSLRSSGGAFGTRSHVVRTWGRRLVACDGTVIVLITINYYVAAIAVGVGRREI